MAQDLLVSNAHHSGRTFLALSSNGETTYTGGSDSLVRIWQTGDSSVDREPDNVVDAAGPITALATIPHDGGWISGSADSHVRRYGRGEKDMASLLTITHGVSVRWVSCDPKGKRVAVASE